MGKSLVFEIIYSVHFGLKYSFIKPNKCTCDNLGKAAHYRSGVSRLFGAWCE
jgi:hypothetical protein